MPEFIPISCKTTTYGRVAFLEEAIHSFLIQDYPGESELVIINDYPLQTLHYDHPKVRIINLKETFPVIGEKENFAIEQCKYDCIVNFDDDDVVLPNHLRNVNKYFPGHHLLHWNNGIAMVSHKIAALKSLGNCGIVYDREFVRKIGGYPRNQAGADMDLVEGIERAGGKVTRAMPPDNEVSQIYNWGNGSYHLSGMGRDDGKRENIIVRHSKHIEEQRQKGMIPTGDIYLNPHWNRDYVAMLKEYNRKNENPKKRMKFIVPIPDSSYYIQQALIQINNFAKYGYDSETHYLIGIIYEKVNPHIVKIAESGLTKAHFHFYRDGRTAEERRYSASLKPHLMYRYFKEYPEEYKHPYVYLDPDLIFMEKFDFTPFLNDNHWYGSDTASYMNVNYIKSKGEGLLEDMCNFVGIDPAIVIANDNSIIGAQYVTKNNTAEFWESVYKKSSQAYIYLNSIQAKYFKPEMTYWLQIWCTEMWITVWECWKRGVETRAHKDFEFHWANHNAKDRKHKMFHNAGISEQDQSKTKHYAKRAYEHVTPFNKELPVSEESLSMEYVKEIKETEKNYPTLIW
jgi:hypothetical protein